MQSLTQQAPLHQTLALLQLPGMGAATFWKLSETFGGVMEVFEQPLDRLRGVLKADLANQIDQMRSQASSEALLSANKTVAWCYKNGIKILAHSDSAYPALLKHINRAPPILFIRGNVDCLSEEQIAMVGSRSASQSGCKRAYEFAAELGARGFVVTSGLALGIDTVAHQGALAGGGRTIAVVGTGIDHTYPARNARLAQQIVDTGGAIISEFPLGTMPTPQNFPQRNRVISGLSLGTVVVEAAIKSGSLITAKYALEQNREVFAIPGSTQNPKAKGCHALIKQGAKLVESVDDIVEELSGFCGEYQRKLLPFDDDPEFSKQEMAVFALLDFDPCSLEGLEQRSTLSVGELISVLTSLELQGQIEQIAGGFVRSK